MIHANADETDDDDLGFKLLARVNLALLVASGAMLSYLLWSGR